MMCSGCLEDATPLEEVSIARMCALSELRTGWRRSEQEKSEGEEEQEVGESSER